MRRINGMTDDGLRMTIGEKRKKLSSLTLVICHLSSVILLSGCASILDKLDNINKPAQMTEAVNPQEKPAYKPMTWPMPETPPPPKQYANSLWQPGARAFFRDGRAARVGDILKVKITINDQLLFNNQTEAKRTTIDNANAPALLGAAAKISKLVPSLSPDPAALLNISGDLDTKGTGTIQRQDQLTTQVAAMVTQMLPNGNMVISGTQEITMNQDVREVGIKGVIRPQDINSDNTIESQKVAEARITYTGRGQMNDIQQPRWGGQVVDAISPF